MMRSSLLILALLFLFAYSCAVNYPVPRRYKQIMGCFEYDYTGLDTLINLYGYYKEPVISDLRGIYKYVNGERQEVGIDTTFYEFMFFDDGVFIGDIGWYDMTVIEYLEYVARNNLDFNNRSFYQGTYTLTGDTIKIQYISPGYGNTWAVKEVWYTIIDRSTLKYIYYHNLGSKEARYDDPIWYTDSAIFAYHVPLDTIPRSSSWLKGEDWIKCEE